ncbi:FKBP-type peptidyl-prolyl cis-trans isomerase [Pedomonas sp. V897]|uniref:FKBP-type peptidyl-prolyl cis-trans isomerase n=1 Tax=Pedomonas sp. V897 TaxID=3446482 RepID=UPI003EDF7BEF
MARWAIALGVLVVGGAAWASQALLPEGLKIQAAGRAFLAQNAAKEGVTTLPSGLQIEVLREGEGPKPGPGDIVVVHYRGWLMDNTEFDSSYARNQPAMFRIGDVIPGWNEGLQQMQQGGKYRLVIPPELGYGAQGAGGGIIPPNAVLQFDVELLAFQSMPEDGAPVPPAGAGEGETPQP